MTTYRQLLAQRESIKRIVAAHRGINPRVFGSVATGTQSAESDVDLLIDDTPGMSMLDVVHMENELSEYFGVKFDVNIARGLPQRWRDQVLREAVAL